MTVHCVGDCRLLEQVGEKQDFECMLTSRGFRHEEFVLRVRRLAQRALDADWNSDYAVTVMRTGSNVSHRYIGGPVHDWVKRCAADLTGGVYGSVPCNVPRSNRSAGGGGLPLERGAE